MSNPTKFVDIYQQATATTHRIPAAELAPGMVEVALEPTGQRVWISEQEILDTTALAPFRHPSFEPTTRAQIREIRKRLRDVYPATFSEWEEGFRRDRLPDREIALWLCLSEVYASIAKERKLSKKGRLALFGILSQCQYVPRQHMRQVIRPSELPPALVDEVIERYYRRRDEEKAMSCASTAKIVGLPEGVLRPLSSLQEPEGRAQLIATDVVLGVNTATKSTSIFYGIESLEEGIRRNGTCAPSQIAFLYDSRTDELDCLVAAVRYLKGSCCYRAMD